MAPEGLTPFRKEYEKAQLRRSDLQASPLEQLKQWLVDALTSGNPDPYAMCVSTLGLDGLPNGRMVLVKAVDERGLVFCTTYSSQKGRELDANPVAAATFYWPECERQVRLSGHVERTTREESAALFHARPWESRLSALLGTQSQPVPNRESLERQLSALRAEYDGREVNLPDHWGGYLVRPQWFEFWQGGIHRMHDRFRYELDGTSWRITRLSP